jgi:hypothetical protein
MLNLLGRWLKREGYGDKMRVHVVYHEPSLIEEAVRKYWHSNLTSLDAFHIRNINLRPPPTSSQGKQAGLNRQPFGTATLAVHDVQLWSLVMGGIHALKAT